MRKNTLLLISFISLSPRSLLWKRDLHACSDI